MKILVTGSAGFIGYHLSKELLNDGHEVIGVDNLNDYYDVKLKKDRLKSLKSLDNSKKYSFYENDISNYSFIKDLFKKERIQIVVNLAAQAGVRYSIENPNVYIDSNLKGFANILEACRESDVEHLVFASSSSVYGMNKKQPFNINDNTDYPISLYAATKKSNELMAHTYSHLFNLPVTGLRFFTVYGEYGRPDMAYFKFTESILDGKPIDIFNGGDMKRDFTYIDDIVHGIKQAMLATPCPRGNSISSSEPPYRIYNLGNNKPVRLIKFIEAIETACGKEAIKNFLPMQPGDVPITFADIDESVEDLNFKPVTSINEGIHKFVQWYKTMYKT